MQIEVKIEQSCTEPRVIILTNQMTEEISELVQKLSADVPMVVAGFRDGRVVLLDQANIIRIYPLENKVFAVTEDGEYQVRLRLYELENRLNPKLFVRISNSEIINLKKVKNFDLSFTGTICVSLSNGTTTYVSRRYVRSIKQVLGI